MEGGYKAWSAAGLRTKLEGTDTPISILKEVTDHVKIEMLLSLRSVSKDVRLASSYMFGRMYSFFRCLDNCPICHDSSNLLSVKTILCLVT